MCAHSCVLSSDILSQMTVHWLNSAICWRHIWHFSLFRYFKKFLVTRPCSYTLAGVCVCAVLSLFLAPSLWIHVTHIGYEKLSPPSVPACAHEPVNWQCSTPPSQRCKVSLHLVTRCAWGAPDFGTDGVRFSCSLSVCVCGEENELQGDRGVRRGCVKDPDQNFSPWLPLAGFLPTWHSLPQHTPNKLP